MKHAILAMGVALLAAACSERPGPVGPDSGNGSGMTVEVQIKNFEFSNANLAVTAGTTVRWRNTTSTFHTVTPDGQSAWQEFQTSALDDTFEVRFDTPGTYRYFCAPHQALGMTGQVVVQ